jgi:hypothetical protein
VIALHPLEAIVEPGQTQLYTAWSCPADSDGRPQLGADGIPGTRDDDCQPLKGEWALLGDPVGELVTGEPGVPSSSASFRATGGGAAAITITAGTGTTLQTGSTTVTVPGEPAPRMPRTVFLDSFDEEVGELNLRTLAPGRRSFLADATRAIARREANGDRATRGQLRLLRQLIPSDFRYQVVVRDLPPEQLGRAVIATIRSAAPDGQVLDDVEVLLEPEGDGLRLFPELVIVDPKTRDSKDGRIPSEVDGVVFLSAEPGDRIVVRAPNLPEGSALAVVSE